MTTEMLTSTINITEDYINENHTFYITNDNYLPSSYISFINFVDFNVVPAISVLGILTNVLTFAILIRPPLNNFSPSVYLAAYCIASALVCSLVTGLGFIFQINDWLDIELRSDSSCKIWSFVKSFLNSSPNWFLTGAAMDRMVAIWCPKRAQSVCSVFMARVFVSLTMVFLTIVTIHEMWSNTIINIHTKVTCQADYHLNMYEYVGLMIRQAVLIFLPSVLLFFLGNFLLLRLCLKHHGRQILNTSTPDLDLTYVVTVHVIITSVLNCPERILQITAFVNNNNLTRFMFQIFYYIGFIAYICLFLVMIVQSRDFREAVVSILRTNTLCCCTKRNSTIELRLMNEYNQVPSASTSV